MAVKERKDFNFSPQRSNVATHMQEETENQINDRLREIYEPCYGRRLSDEEVREIRTNLEAFAEGIMEIAQRLYGRTDSLPESERGTHIVGHEA